MSRYHFLLLALLLAGSFGTQATPRIMRSNMAATTNTALALSLKKEAKGQYLLLVSKEGATAPESFKLMADSTGTNGGTLKFAAGEEARANAVLSNVQDVLAHTPANDGEATGDAAGDLASFVNDVLRKGDSDGIVIVPAAETGGGEPARQSGAAKWLFGIIGLLIGAAGGAVAIRVMQADAKQRAAEPIIEEEVPTAEDPEPDAVQALQKLKKAQKDLRETRSALKAAIAKHEAAAKQQAELEERYSTLEARTNTTTANMAALQQSLNLLQDKAAKEEAYFKNAATGLIRPFTDFASGSRINPADKASQAIMAEQVVVLAFHYYSLVRYQAGIWDEHDVYNLQRISALAQEHKSAMPQSVSVAAKSGYPNLVLTLAALLRTAGTTGAGMDISIRGYRFSQ